ncbi:MAG TPA: hypothetical protein VGI40_01855 [Pirellulaceae bacterium]|jgi:signal transduction histidine kinase
MRHRLRTLLIVLAIAVPMVAVIAWAVTFAVSGRRIADESIRLENARFLREKFGPDIPAQPVNPAIPYES